MPKFNQKVFLKEINKSLVSKEMKAEAYKIVETKVREADQKMMQNFESHPVTREIDSGPDASNLSGALGGYGNLFTFIGFKQGSSPTDIIRRHLRRGTKVYRIPRTVTNPRFVELAFRIKSINSDEIESATPSPWEAKSWVRGVERGMSGLGYYLNEQSENSRSGKGYQSKNKIRGSIFKPIKYIASILEQFNRDMR